MDRVTDGFRKCNNPACEHPIKPIDGFRRSSRYPDGRKNRCKVCEKQPPRSYISRKEQAAFRAQGLKKCSNTACLDPVKPFAGFNVNRKASDGLCSRCRVCQDADRQKPEAKERVRQHRQTPEHKAAHNAARRTPEYRTAERQRMRGRPRKKYRRRKTEAYRATQRRYDQSEGGKASRKAAREKPERKAKTAETEKRRLQRPEVKAKHRAKTHERIATPEWKKARKEYDQSERGKAVRKTVWNRRQARKRRLPDVFTPAQWAACLGYWDRRCAVCRETEGLFFTLAADHWIPFKQKDRCPGTVPWNMLPLCHGRRGAVDACNNRKSARDPVEWLTEKLGPEAAASKLAEVNAYFDSVRVPVP